MLKSLTVENVALIKSAEINFGSGLNVLSGETGAGKSVLMESVNFVLGARADKTMICRGETFCSVTAVFDVFDNSAVKDVFAEYDIEVDDELIIKRVLHEDGRSSVRLNGEAVTAQMLRRITSLIVDVHGQSDHFVLLKEKNQLKLLDDIGGDRVTAAKKDISVVLSSIKDIDEKLKKIGGSEEERAKRLDYIEYCINEIERVGFAENEDDDLSSRIKKLSNSEKIAEAVTSSVSLINGDGGATDVLSESARLVDSLSAFGEEYAELSERLKGILEDLNDVSETLSSSFDEEFDPKEIDVLQSRLDELNALKRKYGGDYNAVREKYLSLTEERDLLVDGSKEAERLSAARSAALSELEKRYTVLSDIRRSVADELSEKLVSKLRELAMSGAAFSVEFKKEQGVLSADGNDSVEFEFSANIGEEPKPLSKIISGGELSRLMLAIKSVSGASFSSFTYIFDEIDAGLSGSAAFTVAENFAEISKTRQIIAVSHLPQIVAMADDSFYIYKKEENGRTYTHVVSLGEDEKIKEVLRLVGGKADDPSAVEHANNLIKRADDYKKSL